MAAREEPYEHLATVLPEPDRRAPAADPVAQLAAVYRDYPGLRALILRRVGDAELAADILQDAAVTTLQKLRDGAIAQPENVGGFLYRVALNHLRNYRRKDRTAVSDPDALDGLATAPADPEWESVGHRQWARVARRVLDEMPTPRDREVLLRFYLRDEAKDAICRELGLSDEHFNRVIFRARDRFRALLEARGYAKSDFLAIGAVAVALAAAAGARLAPPPPPDVAASAAHAAVPDPSGAQRP